MCARRRCAPFSPSHTASGPSPETHPQRSHEAGEPVDKVQEVPPAPEAPVDEKPTAERFSEVGFPAAVLPDWKAAPEAVRYHCLRRIGELLDGLKGHRAARETAEQRAAVFETAWREIEPYDQLARQSGTTLVHALQRYVGIEQLLARDPATAIMHIAQTVNLDLVAFSRAILNQAGPPQMPPPQMPPQQQRWPAPREPVSEIMALREEMESLRQRVNGETNRQKAAYSVTGSPSQRTGPARAPSGSPRESIERAFAEAGMG